MIDLLLLQLFVFAAMAYAASRFRDQRKLRRALLLLAFALHGAALFFLFMPGELKVLRVDYSSFAWYAGVKAPAQVLAVGGTKPRSPGAFMAALLKEENPTIRTSGGDYEIPNRAHRWSFWRPLDSYALNEASGGLVLQDRQAVVPSSQQAMAFQIWSRSSRYGYRVIQVDGTPVTAMGDVLESLSRVPKGGVSHLRIMNPSPDNNVQSVFLSPGMLPDYHVPRALTQKESFGRYLGFSGFPAHLRFKNGNEFDFTMNSADGTPFLGPDEFLDNLFEANKTRVIQINDNAAFGVSPGDPSDLWIQPRAALFPWVHASIAVSWFLGFLGMCLRPVLAFANLPVIVRYWDFLPKQYYALDDRPFSAPGFLPFKLSAMILSFLFAAFAWRMLKRLPLLSRLLSTKAEFAFMILLPTLLQLLDFFVIHYRSFP